MTAMMETINSAAIRFSERAHRCTRQGSDLNRHLVTAIANGLEDRSPGIGFELLAQPAHQHVDGAVEAVDAARGRAALRKIEQLIAGKKPAGPVEEDFQQIELRPRQLDPLTAGVDDGALFRIGGEVRGKPQAVDEPRGTS